VTAPLTVVATDRHRLHAPLAEIEASGLQPPFEHPGRADAILTTLGADDRFTVVEPDDWGEGPVRAVHDPGLVDFLARAWREYQSVHPGTHDVVADVFVQPGLLAGMDDDLRPPAGIDIELGRWAFETTTPITEGTYAAARASVDVALTAVRRVLDGETAAYGLCRPPGHHAPTSLYGGYCFFNNAAVAAHHAVVATGGRVTVLDVDYHHGNGTQQIFYRRGDVQYVSLHGDPERAYPYLTGRVEEEGAGPGRGATTNLPLPALTDDDAYLGHLERAIEVIDRFDPALVVVSLGVDTYEHDPISDLAVSAEGFARQGRSIRALGRPVVVVQEGGYDVDAIGANVAQFLNGLITG
jgi:acetoin utilization deacetylase AcuC-like enzyme